MKKTYEVSYIKTQWLRLLIAIAFFVVACVYAFSPAADTSTLEGVYQDIKTSFNFFMYFLNSMIWAIMSFIDYHDKCRDKMNERIYDLEKRIEALETRAITDIDKVSNNNYMVRRRLGPDKDVQYPEEEDD